MHYHKSKFLRFANAAFEFLLLILTFIFAGWLRSYTPMGSQFFMWDIWTFLPISALYALVIVGCNAVLGSYRTLHLRNSIKQLFLIALTSLMGLALMATAFYVFRVSQLSRLLLVYYYLLSVIMIYLKRLVFDRLADAYVRKHDIVPRALLIGGVYLLCRKDITWHIPVSFIGTVALLTLIFGSKNGGGYTHVEWMLDNLLSGGLLLGAFFMATDYSTSPVTAPGRIIYGVGCGALTVLIRVFGGFPEGVSFAILIMNCCAWMFDKHTQRRQFGVSREDVKAKKAAAKAAKKEAKEAAANG